MHRLMLTFIALGALTVAGAAQQPAPQPTLRFEVAAIKPVADVPPGARIGYNDAPSAVLSFENLTLRMLISSAYASWTNGSAARAGWTKRGSASRPSRQRDTSRGNGQR